MPCPWTRAPDLGYATVELRLMVRECALPAARASASREQQSAPESWTEMRRKARNLLLLIHIGTQSWKKAMIFCSTKRCEALSGMKTLMFCSTKRCGTHSKGKALKFCSTQRCGALSKRKTLMCPTRRSGAVSLGKPRSSAPPNAVEPCPGCRP